MTIKMNRYEEAIRGNGMEITDRSTHPNGYEIIFAQIRTTNGLFLIICGANGCAKLCKPNGTIKWVHGKTYAQMNRIIAQVIEANNM